MKDQDCYDSGFMSNFRIIITTVIIFFIAWSIYKFSSDTEKKSATLCEKYSEVVLSQIPAKCSNYFIRYTIQK